MRVLFVSFPHHTHYFSMVPLASALRTAGHEVRVASHPEITDQITAAGLTAVPVGTGPWYADDPWAPELFGQLLEEGSGLVQGFDFTGEDRSQWTHESLLALESLAVPALYASVSNDAMLDDLVDYARHWRPDLVVWEQHTFAGAVVARAVGAAHARLLHGMDITVRARQEFLRLNAALPPGTAQDPTAEWLGRVMDRYVPALGFAEEMVTGQWTVDITPPSSRFDLGLPTAGVRYVPHNGASVVPDWLRAPAERRRVCLTLGVSGELDTSFSFAEGLDALADVDAEIVATLGGAAREELTAVPDNARLVDFVPLNDLLPTCAAVVHHGGIGTRSTAELHGVPQILLPYGWDTVAKARRVEELGYGLCLPAHELTADGLRAAVLRLLEEPSFAGAAAKVRAEIGAEPTPNDLVPVLERMTAAARHTTEAAPSTATTVPLV